MEEIWKDIPGYEGVYQASTFGRISSISHYQGRWNKVYTRKRRFILKQFFDKDGYLSVSVSKNCRNVRSLVHRLVALTFIPNPNQLPQINHKDENKANNRVENLEWCDNSYNQLYGTAPERKKIKMLNRESTSKPVMAIFDDGRNESFPSMNEASRKLNISWFRIRSIIKQNKKVYNSNVIFKYL